MSKIKAFLAKPAGKVKATAVAAVMAVLPNVAYCANVGDANTTLKKILNMIFNVLIFGGIISLGYGVVLLFKAITSQDAGDSHGITKGIGWVVGGVIMLVAKPIVNAISPVQIDNFDITQ